MMALCHAHLVILQVGCYVISGCSSELGDQANDWQAAESCLHHGCYTSDDAGGHWHHDDDVHWRFTETTWNACGGPRLPVVGATICDAGRSARLAVRQPVKAFRFSHVTLPRWAVTRDVNRRGL
mmetsp:Transcript_54944/g.112189  ORF Transcript_54944/g.112189 Transcript_54944/m.112189 type:complete len:124 (-) Transcript_54944:35-406(-)